MNRRLAILSTLTVALAAFGIGAFLYSRAPADAPAKPMQSSDQLVRPHSPVMGAANAKVTIVEFFDPSCEACRAFYPIVKEIIAKYPNDVRLVLRYAPFHKGSDEAVRILEAARLQNVFQPVLDALVAMQPEWAVHGEPRLDLAWKFAADAGLDEARAKASMMSPEITATLNKDIEDGVALGISRTPTFFVNGKPLVKFGEQQLYDLVEAEIAASQ